MDAALQMFDERLLLGFMQSCGEAVSCDDVMLKSVLKDRPVLHQASALLPIRGLCTTNIRDVKGEIVEQEDGALDWDYFLTRGWFTDNHRDGSADIIGFPTKVEMVTLPSGRKGHIVEGYLFDDDLGRRIHAKMKLAQSVNRPFGFSIEGIPLQKIPGHVLRAKIVNVAVTPIPVNQETIALAKSLGVEGMSAGYAEPSQEGGGSGAALVPQSLDRKLAVATIGGEIMATPEEIKASLQKFVDGLKPEEQDALKEITASMGGSTPAGTAEPPAPPAGDAPPAAEPPAATPPAEPPAPPPDAPEPEKKGLTPEPEATPPATEDEPVAVDVEEFLESLVAKVDAGFQTLKAALLDAIEAKFGGIEASLKSMKGVPEGEDATGMDLKSLKLELKGIHDALNASPLPGATPAATVVPPPEAMHTDMKTGEAVDLIKNMLIGKLEAAEKANDYNTKFAVGDLLCRIDAGHLPTAADLAQHGVVLPA